MHEVIARHLLWLSVGGSVAAFLIARALGGPLELVVTLSSVIVLCAAAVLERLMPWRWDWNRAHGDTRTDLTSAALLIGGVDPLLKAVLPVLVILLWPSGASSAAAPIGLAFGAQVLGALLWIELAKYASHRWHHQSRALWWLHALHHGSERLYTLNNFRFHPLNHAINQIVSLVPLLLLGVSHEVLLACLAITQPVQMLQHANIDLRSGWLNQVFSSNEAHRWHHSNRADEANCNFGSALLLWDHVFGTFRPADASSGPSQIGLFGDGGRYAAREGYFTQLVSMFGPRCCRA